MEGFGNQELEAYRVMKNSGKDFDRIDFAVPFTYTSAADPDVHSHRAS